MAMRAVLVMDEVKLGKCARYFLESVSKLVIELAIESGFIRLVRPGRWR
jgi:hypothetical protein